MPAGRFAGRRAFALAAMCGLLLGCQHASRRDVGTIGDAFGPAGRTALGLKRDQERKLDPSKAERGQAEFDRALALFEQGQFADAETQFKRIAWRYRDFPVAEDAMFRLGEARFLQEKFPAAEDAYADLFKKFPSTRYVEDSTKRLFSIARAWLNDPKPASEVELVKYEEHPNAQSLDSESNSRPLPLVPNVTDRRRPVFDTEGRAIAALRLVWLHDPTGPLADDSLMMSATHHLRQQNFQEADRLLAIIREEYPQSPFASHAYILGSHAKLASYQGAAYDGRTLDDARKLTQSTVRLFPEAPQRGKLLSQLDQIKSEAAARDWEKAQFYLRKGRPESAAIYAQLILESYPDSSYAAPARELLTRIGPKDPSLVLPDLNASNSTETTADVVESTSAAEPAGQVRLAGGEQPTSAKRKRWPR